MKRHGKEHMQVNKEVHFGYCSFSTADSTARSPPSISYTFPLPPDFFQQTQGKVFRKIR